MLEFLECFVVELSANALTRALPSIPERCRDVNDFTLTCTISLDVPYVDQLGTFKNRFPLGPIQVQIDENLPDSPVLDTC